MEIKLNTGDKITIPEDCEATIEGNQIIIKKQEGFKDGDILISKDSKYSKYFVIFKSYDKTTKFAFNSYFNSIVELLHGTTINSLNQIRLSLTKKIENLEGKDEWAADAVNQVALEKAKEQKELVNLIIGYKRYQQEIEEINANKKALQEQLAVLNESQKSPEDKIKELESKLASLDIETF